MSAKRWLLVVLVASLVVLAVGAGPGVAGTAQALPPGQRPGPAGSTIPYTGRLSDDAGQPVPQGAYDFAFALYETETGGQPLWSEVQAGVPVQDGAFALSLGSVAPLPAAALDGRSLWLAVGVRAPEAADFAALSPRQQVSAASPSTVASTKANGACPHNHFGEVWSGWTGPGDGLWLKGNVGWSSGILLVDNNGSGPSIWGYNNGGGNALRGDAEGPGSLGVFGSSEQAAGVVGRSATYNGVEGYSAAPDVWAGVYGEAPHFGVFGRATTSSWYGVFSDGTMGTSGDLWVGGNITAVGSKAGYVADVMQNDDTLPLQAGDVVAISGAGPAILGEIPVIKVRRAAIAGSSAVVGIVDKRYTPPPQEAAPDAAPPSAVDGASIAPGEYLTVVTLGAYKAIKVDASYGAIAPGDLLVASPHPGYAMRAASPAPGTIVGKALGALESGTGLIPVIVTLQ